MAEEKKPVSVCFHYVKSNYFRVIHADGMYGGLTPCGGIFFALYSDRQPLPELTVQSVLEACLSHFQTKRICFLVE
ncbi:MAG TPA: hypothetical protein VKW06_16380 [Candidatus Angelobacter sp.]|nr:hypothetical protein [Candidatus Angelobacter sp.]